MLLNQWLLVAGSGIVFLLVGLLTQRLLGKTIILFLSVPFLALAGLGAFELKFTFTDVIKNKLVLTIINSPNDILVYFFIFMALISLILAIYYTFITSKEVLDNNNID